MGRGREKVKTTLLLMILTRVNTYVCMHRKQYLEKYTKVTSGLSLGGGIIGDFFFFFAPSFIPFV